MVTDWLTDRVPRLVTTAVMEWVGVTVPTVLAVGVGVRPVRNKKYDRSTKHNNSCF